MLSIIITAAAITISGVTSIRGRVLDQDDQPIVGAVVCINSATPKENANTNPSQSSPDCGTIAVTDQHGQFQFADVSDESILSITAGATNYRGMINRSVDPTATDDLEFQLTKLDTSDNGRLVTGRLVSPEGVPVAGAAITINRNAQMITLPQPTTGAVTPSTVSDLEGGFALHIPGPMSSVTVKIEASGYAPSLSPALHVGRTNPPIQINAGTSLTGRLVANGEPVAGLMLEVVQQNRSLGNLITPRKTRTAEDGTFRIDLLPPMAEFTLCSPLGQSTGTALPVTLVTTPRAGMLADLGDVAVGPSHRLTVKLISFGGQPIPTGARCYLKQKHASSPDYQSFSSSNGYTLTFQGVASEVVELGIAVDGYEVIHTDPFCQIDVNRRLNLKVLDARTLTIAIKKSQ